MLFILNDKICCEALIEHVTGIEPASLLFGGQICQPITPHMHILNCQWRIRDSNPSPHACKACALPDELIPQIKTPNAFYSRSSDIKSVSQNYRIPSIYINNVIFILRTSCLMLIFFLLRKICCKKCLIKISKS